jgi:hypothetical protein
MEGGRSDEDTTRFDFHGDGMPEEEEEDDDEEEDDSPSISSSSRSMEASTSIILARGLLPRRVASSLTEGDDSRSFRRRAFFETSARRLTGLVLLRQLLSSSLNIKMTSLSAESAIVG